MSIVPELIFQTVIVRGIRTLREDSRFIDQLFRNLSDKDRQQLREFLKSNVINLVLNYPRSTLTVPSIVILLKNENEKAAYLGDSMGLEVPEELGYESSVEDEVLGGTGSVSTLSGPGNVIFGPHRVLSATNNTLKVSDRTFSANQFVGNDTTTVTIVAGVGVGQTRDIVANSHNSLMIASNWTTNPDTTSIFEIREPTIEILGTVPKLYDRRDNDLARSLERRGSLYTNKYQIQLVASNQEQTIYLYTILKSIFTLSRLFMEQQGVINFMMSGTDFVNRSEYIPDYAFMRAMNVEFDHPFDVYERLEGIIDAFTLILSVGDDVAIETVETDISPAAAVVTGP